MIRKYENEDIDVVIDVVIDVWRQASALAHPFLDSEFIEQVQMDMHTFLANSESWIYQIEGVAVGFISMVSNEIGGLFVLPQFQSKGIGSELVNFVSKNLAEIEVEVFEKNIIGRSFYEKYGFKLLKCSMHAESGEVVWRLKIVNRFIL